MVTSALKPLCALGVFCFIVWQPVLAAIDAFAPAELDSAVALLDTEMPIKRLLMLLEMARQGAGGSAKSGGRITFARFMECMNDLAG